MKMVLSGDFRGQSYQKYIDYVESATEEELSKPTKELTGKSFYSSLGLNFWYQIYFSNKEKRAS